jgi:hypothetical protein
MLIGVILRELMTVRALSLLFVAATETVIAASSPLLCPDRDAKRTGFPGECREGIRSIYRLGNTP